MTFMYRMNYVISCFHCVRRQCSGPVLLVRAKNKAVVQKKESTNYKDRMHDHWKMPKWMPSFKKCIRPWLKLNPDKAPKVITGEWLSVIQSIVLTVDGSLAKRKVEDAGALQSADPL